MPILPSGAVFVKQGDSIPSSTRLEFPMKIALIGATGFVGSAVLTELLSRGHAVTALARHPEKIAAHAGLQVLRANVLDARQVAAAVKGQDAIVSAYNPGWSEPRIHE